MFTLGMFNLGIWELLIIGVLGLLIFGKRLPEVGKNLGKGIVEFKKGLAWVENDIDRAAEARPAPKPALDREPQAAASLPAQDLAAENEALRQQLRQAQEQLKSTPKT